MKTRETARQHLRWLKASSRSLLTLAWLLSGVGCSKRAEDCNYTLTCAGADDSGAGGGTSNGGSSNTGGATHDAGTTPPCNPECSGNTAVCDVNSHKCVECGDAGDCSGGAAVCNTTKHECVECTSNSSCKTPVPYCEPDAGNCIECRNTLDCSDPKNSICSNNTCVPCKLDIDCTHLGGTPLCKLDSTGKAGTCVQCTTANESACNGTSCNPATNLCTTTTIGSVDYCHACVADTECVGGNQANPTARCVAMNFGTTLRGTYCLPIGTTVGSCTSPPFGVLKTAAVSTSGAPAQNYCGIDELTTTCEAVQDLISLKHCSLSGECGCINSNNCAGGTCPSTGSIAGTCTISCAVPAQCPTTLTCSSATPICH